MDKQEAKTLLTAKLAEYRRLAYDERVAKVGDVDCLEVTGLSGVEYLIEVQFFWDGEADGNVRVMGSIDDGGFICLLLLPFCLKSRIVTSMKTNHTIESIAADGRPATA